MNELIKITETENGQVVSARDLHQVLEVKTEFSKWCKRMFEYGFTENQDYTLVKIGERYAYNKIDYALTIDCSKEIAMLQRTPRGKEVRNYFIACERQLKQTAVQKPIALEEMMIYQLQQAMEIKNRQSLLESNIKQLEEKVDSIQTQNAPIEHFSIMGYCRNIKKQISLEEAKVYGTKCRALCRNEGFVIGRIPDPRFGTVNTYPLDVLKSIIKN